MKNVKMKTKVAILGSGNIGTDLMIKILETSDSLELVSIVGTVSYTHLRAHET